MSKAKSDSLKRLVLQISDIWETRREEEARTMCAKRRPTDEEIDRAMIIGKWFVAWNDETGQCPIDPGNGHWGKKLCALFEWIATLETDTQNTQAEGAK